MLNRILSVIVVCAMLPLMFTACDDENDETIIPVHAKAELIFSGFTVNDSITGIPLQKDSITLNSPSIAGFPYSYGTRLYNLANFDSLSLEINVSRDDTGIVNYRVSYTNSDAIRDTITTGSRFYRKTIKDFELAYTTKGTKFSIYVAGGSATFSRFKVFGYR